MHAGLQLAVICLVAAAIVVGWILRQRHRWGTGQKIAASIVAVVLGFTAISLLVTWLFVPTRVELRGDPTSTMPTPVPERISTATPP